MGVFLKTFTLFTIHNNHISVDMFTWTVTRTKLQPGSLHTILPFH